MSEYFDTVVIGAGQAGLAISYFLTLQGRQHVLLERREIGAAWKYGRWDSFTLVTPNWTVKLPGFEYAGDDPEGYMSRDQVVKYLCDYAAKYEMPVRTGVNVTAVEEMPDGFAVATDIGVYTAANVVVAAGAFQKPKLPAYAVNIAPTISQLHSGEYKNPNLLPQGAVLVVGSAQSGCQIAEELYQSGRKVFFSTGKAIRLPRRYRGKDCFDWVIQLGMLDRLVETLENKAERFDANPQLTGKNGGHDISLHTFAKEGVTLLGRLTGASGTKLYFAEDLRQNIERADKRMVEFLRGVDKMIAARGLEVPEEPGAIRVSGDNAFESIGELDLDSAGISTIIWAAGYSYDFSWIKFPIFENTGYPIQNRGVTSQPGLYFIGLQWLHKAKSSLLFGVGEDAAYIAEHIAGRT